ncbi:MAG TPA: FAD-dependent oxidoreductase [Ktedonobacterales bacterium]
MANKRSSLRQNSRAAPSARFQHLSTFKLPALEERRQPAPAGRAFGPEAQRALRAGYADVLVIGNGIAGLTASVEARRYAPDADILIVTEQNHPTINTPALKQFGAGQLAVEQLLAYPPGMERQSGIGIVNQRATKLDTVARQVHLADGQTIKYGRLLLATGSQPAGLPTTCPGRDFDGVLSLHNLEDYLDLRRRLPEVASVVVIGGGYHAAETAMLLRHWKVRVTWLIRGETFMAQMLDEVASDMLIRHIQRLGVDVRLETEVAGIIGRIGSVVGVMTKEEEFIPCQVVAVCTGTAPAAELAEGTGVSLSTRHGLKVNGRLKTAVSDVFAAGDVAAVFDPQTGRHAPRAQWYSAFQQGRLAAAALTGASIPEGAEAGVLGCFWHATQLGELGVLAAGAPMLSERDHRDNEVLSRGSSRFYRRLVVRDNRLIGYLALGERQPGGLAIKRLIDEQIDMNEIKRQLLLEGFDVRSFFTRQRLHALRSGQSAAMSPLARPSRSRRQLQPMFS